MHVGSRRSMAMYPIDILPSVDYDDLLSASDKYLSSLESSSSENHEWFDTLHTKVQHSLDLSSLLSLFKILSITLVVNDYCGINNCYIVKIVSSLKAVVFCH